MKCFYEHGFLYCGFVFWIKKEVGLGHIQWLVFFIVLAYITVMNYVLLFACYLYLKAKEILILESIWLKKKKNTLNTPTDKIINVVGSFCQKKKTAPFVCIRLNF